VNTEDELNVPYEHDRVLYLAFFPDQYMDRSVIHLDRTGARPRFGIKSNDHLQARSPM
jgi:hypothetical protein